MADNIFDEGCLQFDFSACAPAERFDNKDTNPYGMKAVDFVAETDDILYFIEVKDFQNPRAPEEQRENDLRLLIEAGTARKQRTLLNPDEDAAVSVFNLEMGGKIKDSLLRWYISGEVIAKKVVYILFIRLDKLDNPARRRLAEKIADHIPTKLNKQKDKPTYPNFTELRLIWLMQKNYRPMVYLAKF
jgi:hypothetical protein